MMKSRKRGVCTRVLNGTPNLFRFPISFVSGPIRYARRSDFAETHRLRTTARTRLVPTKELDATWEAYA